MIEDYFRYGIGNLRKQKLRSWLTMIGIFIGMASVVALISLGQGLESSINEQFESIGVDKLFIQPKGIFGAPTTEVKPLTNNDLKAIENTLGVKDAAGMSFQTAKIEFNDIIRYFTLVGFEAEDELINEFYNYDIERGENLKKGEKSKVVLGNAFIDDSIFEKDLDVRDKVLVNDLDFKVKGFYETLGNRPDDQSLYLPLNVIEDLYNIEDQYSFIVVKVSGDAEVISEKIERALRRERGVDEGNEDFSIQTPKEILESFSTILNILQIFLIGIAGISLIVGGIGIMNTMYTAILERTREIGVMKSVGATNSDILSIFLIESGILGLVGGVIGIIFGVGFSKLVEIIAANAGFSIIKVSFPLELLVGTLLFSFVVGSLSGVVPAYKASKLKPVDALRHE
jgi:putative ABC transport system permease protein